MNLSVRDLWVSIIPGAGLIAAWFAATRTTLLLAYKGGTLSQVHAICDSGIGQFGRLLNTAAAAKCNGIDNTLTWWNVAGIAGVLLVITGVAALIYRAARRPEPRPVP